MCCESSSHNSPTQNTPFSMQTARLYASIFIYLCIYLFIDSNIHFDKLSFATEEMDFVYIKAQICQQGRCLFTAMPDMHVIGLCVIVRSTSTSSFSQLYIDVSQRNCYQVVASTTCSPVSDALCCGASSTNPSAASPLSHFKHTVTGVVHRTLQKNVSTLPH